MREKKIKIKYCKHCLKIFKAVGNQTVCKICTIKRHKAECKRWYQKSKEPVKSTCGITFEFRGGYWYWSHINGLNNGPFETLKKARRDAKKAI